MKKIIFSIIFLAIVLITSKVQAAGNARLYSNKESVEVGEEFSISVSLSSIETASFTMRVTVDTSKVEFVSGPSNSNFRNGRIIYTWTDPNGGTSPITGGTIATFTLRGISSGNAGFSVSGDFYAPDESELDLDFSGVTVTVIAKSTPDPTLEPTIEETPQIIQTPEPTKEENVSPTTELQTPTQTTIATPDVILPKETSHILSSNANLKSLRLDVTDLFPSFDPNILNYEAYVNETVSSVDVLAMPEDENSIINITGNNDLQIGTNYILVTVTAQNENQKTYTITVNKSNQADELNCLLENLSIEDVFLSPDFKPDEFNYKAEIDSTKESVNILAVPQIEGASVNIQGQNNLKFGNNTIEITVTSRNGEKSNTYTIIAYRNMR